MHPAQRFSRSRGIGQIGAHVLIAATLAAMPLLAAEWFRPAVVNVRWPSDMRPSERITLESRFGLTAGSRTDDTTWQYQVHDYSRARLQALVTHPRVEDTHNIDRRTFRPIDTPQELEEALAWSVVFGIAVAASLILLGRRAAAARFWSILAVSWGGLALWQVADVSGPHALMWVALAAAISGSWRRPLQAMDAASTRALRLLRAAFRGGARVAAPTIQRLLGRVQAVGESCETWASRPRRWIAVTVAVWALLMIPYVWIGPLDVEEFFTGVVSTKLAVEAIARGAWPFWNLDFGLGVPQPFRVQFIAHPASPLCVVAEDCGLVLRAIASAHMLLGALCMALLALRFTGAPFIAVAAGVSYCCSSSFAQTMLHDDWPITAIGESLRPVLLYAGLRIGSARGPRDALLWTLVLGGLGGLSLGMSFTVIMLTIVALVLLSAPGLRRSLPWFVAAGALAVVIGGWHTYHIWEQVSATPAGIPRTDHSEPGWAAIVWSAFLRPLFGSDEADTWRLVFFGPVFAAAAVAAAVTARERQLRPLQVGLAIGLIGLLIPPAFLLSINSAQWMYRAELNVFGILLGAYGIWRFTARPSRRRWRGALVLVQVVLVVLAVFPSWSAVMARAFHPAAIVAPPSPAIARRIAEAVEARGSGRVAFAPVVQDALRRRRLPLAPNQLQLEGVPAMAAVTFGVANHDLYPTEHLLETEIRMDSAALQNQASMSVLGIRYLVTADEPVPPHVRLIRELGSGLRLYENPGAWPEAFFVERLPTEPLPRLPGCAHRQFLCADFSRYPLQRAIEPLQVTRLGDGVRLTFTPSERRRYVLLTQWHVPGWEVTEGRASIARAAEQLVGIQVEPGQSSVAVRFRPRTRAALFMLSVATEIATLLVLAWLAWTRRRLAAPAGHGELRDGGTDVPAYPWVEPPSPADR